MDYSLKVTEVSHRSIPGFVGVLDLGLFPEVAAITWKLSCEVQLFGCGHRDTIESKWDLNGTEVKAAYQLPVSIQIMTAEGATSFYSVSNIT